MGNWKDAMNIEDFSDRHANENNPPPGTMRTETQGSVSQWATETFGPESSLLRVAVRANEELAELLRCLAGDAPPEKVVEEIADVVIVLYRLAERIGIGLDTVVTQTDVHDSPGLTTLRMALMIHAEIGIVLESLESMEMLAGVDDELVSRIDHNMKSSIMQIGMTATELAAGFGALLPREIDKKMVINRRRKWKLDDTGRGQHIQE
ncbi:MAG: MazG-like family protein [Gammaproteobacteria bacterium]